MTQESSETQIPAFLPVLITSIFLAAVGLVGLVILVLMTVPTLGPRWLLYFLVTLLFSGLALPVIYYLHLRFPSKSPVTAKVLIRETLWVGIFVDIILWLQFGRVLNFALAIFIALGLIFIEILIRWRERNRFEPDKSSDD